MSRVLLRLAVFGLLQLAIARMLFPLALSAPRPGYLAALDDKLALMRADGPPYVVVVGGSSVAFGIDSRLLEQHFSQPVVNLGLHAVLKLDFYLRIVEQHCRAGDLIVLLPEYELLSDRQPMSIDDLRRLLRNCPAAGRYLGGNLTTVKQFLDTMALSELAYWTQKGTAIQRGRWFHPAASRRVLLSRDLRPGAPRVSAGQQPANTSIYRRASFNRYGDMVGHHGRQPPVARHHGGPIVVDENHLAKTIQRLNRCAAICRRRGATVVFSYPPILDTTFVASTQALQRAQSLLEKSLEMPIINQPQDTVFAESQFFDTDLHLVQGAQQQRSQILLQGLSREIARQYQPGNRRWR